MQKPNAFTYRSVFLLVIFFIFAVIFIERPHPCQEALTYHIGKVDERFGLSRQEVSDAVKQAASIWEKADSRELFREESNGVIEVNLVYDYRQEAADKLKSLSYKIDNSKSSYEDLKSVFENKKNEYEQKSDVLAKDYSSYNSRVNTFNAECESTRRQGGVPDDVRNRLMVEKEELTSISENLRSRQEELKSDADTINSLVIVINQIANNRNLDIVNYRNEGKKLGDEFCEGNYVRKKGSRMVNIFQFADNKQLIRVITHELGHALGLDHNNNPQAVMYRLMQTDSLDLAPEDITALKVLCGKQ
jgi:hypothetical protein